MEKRPRIYVDTSVIGGCCDEEFEKWSNQLMKEFRMGVYIPVLSELTLSEIAEAPEAVQEALSGLLEAETEVMAETAETIALADEYVQAGILPPKFENDARHIAVATVCNADMIVSWNFKHIVHFDQIRKFNSVNLREGYKVIEIYSPREVISDEI